MKDHGGVGHILKLLTLWLILPKTGKGNVHSPPGKPELTMCRSPDKETFTCWWKPGYDGGFPTSYALYYTKERDEQVYECPDYGTGGENSCFFDKKHTSIWTIYVLTVNATNMLGSNISDPVHVDVAYIVQPHPPANITVKVEASNPHAPTLLIKWSPPLLADVKSGWITLEYELRMKVDKGEKWEVYHVGQQTQFIVHSFHPGQDYIIEVRCKPDHGFWSEWSTPVSIHTPKSIRSKDTSVWVLIAVFAFVSCLICISTLILKRDRMKTCFLPPVPGPRIKGLDTQLLKSGKSEDLLSALGCQSFPPISDYDDLLVEFIEVDDNDDIHVPSSNAGLQKWNGISVAFNETDNDSGRGSCDSPSLIPPEKCSEMANASALGHYENNKGKEVALKKDSHKMKKNASSGRKHAHWNGSSAKAYTWPAALIPACQTQKPAYHSFAEVCKMALGAMNLNVSAFRNGPEEKKQTKTYQNSQMASIIPEEKSTRSSNTKCLHSTTTPEQVTTWISPNEKTPFLTAEQTDYVETYKVNQNDILILRSKKQEKTAPVVNEPTAGNSKEYTKVSAVVDNNVLLIMQDTSASPCQPQEVGKKASCAITQWPPGESEDDHPAAICGSSLQSFGPGYVDPTSFIPHFS
ncbi:prolactin receptor isoform X2 [Protopterus annectens]|nr:prolactin receptor isoform X2 [Protopterus annectens]XP_043926067.1 prolactin receptor isoform X2 [Protopterus annectens]XP_043926075.1 prolactin receptor isoform X2 [Protopterus annectens]